MMSAKIRARELARAAKARRDETRIGQERRILEATESFYVADGDAAVAREVVAVAEARRAAAVGMLMDLKEPVESVASLCGISAREVRALIKRHRSNAPTPIESPEADAPVDDDDSDVRGSS